MPEARILSGSAGNRLVDHLPQADLELKTGNSAKISITDSSHGERRFENAKKGGSLST